MIEVVVAGLGVIPPGTDPLLLLKEREGERVVPIGIGPLEAQAIAFPLEGMQPPRPMTHDVFTHVIDRLGARPRRVEITELTQGTFFARLVLEQTGEPIDVDIRPSDAVALAVRTGIPIFIADAVVDETGILVEQPDERPELEPKAEDEPIELDESKLTPFREFIETLDIDDLDEGKGKPST